MSGQDVAVLDENGVIVDVVTVSPDDYVTDPSRRTVRLPSHHDMRSNLHSYKYDYLRGRFEPITVMGRATRDGVDFADAIVDTLYLLSAKMGMQIPGRLKKALNKRGEL